MDHGLLDVLRYFLLGLFWLFLLYAARMVIVEVRRGHLERASLGGGEEIGGVENAQPRRSMRVRVLEPEELAGQRFSLDGETTIGRSPLCTISIPDDSFISNVHARIVARDGGIYLEDLDSTNGTFLNSRRVDEPERLRRGDRFTVGNALFEVGR